MTIFEFSNNQPKNSLLFFKRNFCVIDFSFPFLSDTFLCYSFSLFFFSFFLFQFLVNFFNFCFFLSFFLLQKLYGKKRKIKNIFNLKKEKNFEKKFLKEKREKMVEKSTKKENFLFFSFFLGM